MAYTIEEEQELNQLKEWWKDNGKSIIAAFILGVGGMLAGAIGSLIKPIKSCKRLLNMMLSLYSKQRCSSTAS